MANWEEDELNNINGRTAWVYNTLTRKINSVSILQRDISQNGEADDSSHRQQLHDLHSSTTILQYKPKGKST